jgi:hypothetical protein
MRNGVFAQPRSLVVRAGALRSGQAPGLWKRELCGLTDRIGRVLRSCAWIAELNQIHPLFLGQPLLGSALESITALGVANSEDTTTPPSQRFRPVIHPQSSSAPNQQKPTERLASTSRANSDSLAPPRKVRKIPNATSEAAGTAEVFERNEQVRQVLQLSPGAEGSVLRRCAGAEVYFPSDKPDTEESASLASVLPVIRPPSSAPAFQSLLPSRHWQDLIAYRAAKDLLRNWPATTPAVLSRGSTIERQGWSRSVSDSPLLGEQWRTPFDGPTATAVMLAQLSRQVEVNDAGAVSKTKRPRPHPSTDNEPLTARSGSPGQAETAQHRTETHEANSQDRGSRHAEFIPRPDLIDRLPVQEAGDSQPSGERASRISTHVANRPERPASLGADEPSSLPNIAPPALTQSLPPLLPSASLGAAVMQVAGAVARDGARRDEVSAAENDLSQLAAQMKRILDEEARRHGIDV